jgi:hypothetical protein
MHVPTADAVDIRTAVVKNLLLDRKLIRRSLREQGGRHDWKTFAVAVEETRKYSPG